ncbi:MAG TPA: amidohydrolase [Steroidobacteraceae bacterium]|jgi:aminobenzoyl-glutamate utilization protein B|nr:amidohydrolase [Steroidobacteraceae bacterium]
MKSAALCLSLALLAPAALAADPGSGLKQFLAARAQRDAQLARTIWEYAEVGYQETKSSALLQKELTEAGFTVEAGVAGIPTAFVASSGSGKPVIGILAEFDALPGINQDSVPDRKPIEGKKAGHACGHNLFGTASVSAGIALADWLKESGTKGTIRVYGTPAEEGGSGKVYMVRAGLFNDVDAVLHWHPSDVNFAGIDRALANKSAKFRFHGLSAHASGAPDKGRSALDGVEALDMMANMMREHIPSDARMHYVITSGGSAPNVVPDFAEVYYYVRHGDAPMVEAIFERLVKAAEGAALGTGTTMDYEVIGGTHNLLANETLSKVMNAKLNEVGGFGYTPGEQAFAEKIYATLMSPSVELDSHEAVQPFDFERPGLGSTDVGDVSWTVPTAGLRTATWVPGTSAHSWQATAADGMSIGFKGMHVASQTLALTARELFSRPDILAKAKAEFDKRRGPDFRYKALLGDRPPALDYRKSATGGE